MTSYLFDFNGTLYQDTPMHKSAWREYFRRMHAPFTDENFYKYMCGPPNSEILRRMIRPDERGFPAVKRMLPILFSAHAISLPSDKASMSSVSDYNIDLPGNKYAENYCIRKFR